MKALKLALIFVFIFIIGIWVLIRNPVFVVTYDYSDYATCIGTFVKNFLHPPYEYLDSKTICKERGYYTEEIDGIVWEFPNNEPYTGLIKYHEDNDWGDPVLLEWYEYGVLIEQEIAAQEVSEKN